jgi:hypothetical protein
MERIPAKQYLAEQAGEVKGDRRRVRGTKPVTVEGISFHSTKEAVHYSNLRLLEKAGLIRDLRLQVPFELQGRDAPIMTAGGGKVRRYFADFVFFDVALGVEVRQDAKGHDTEHSEIKRAIMAAMGKPVEVV